MLIFDQSEYSTRCYSYEVVRLCVLDDTEGASITLSPINIRWETGFKRKC